MREGSLINRNALQSSAALPHPASDTAARRPSSGGRGERLRIRIAKFLHACICLVTFSLFAAESAPSIAPAATPSATLNTSVFLITDYLPPAIYEGDSISANFRIENAYSNKREFEITAKASDDTGAELKSLIQKVSVAPKTVEALKFEFESKRVARIRFEMKESNSAAPLADLALILIRDVDAWPTSQVTNGRLMNADGAIMIPVVEKKRAVEDRTFAPMKWIFGSSSDAKSAPSGKCIVFAPGVWKINADDLHPLGPWKMDGASPLLTVMRQIFDELKNAPPGEIKRTAILLPPEDLDFATDPKTYRVLLDALLARLTHSCLNITLIAPFKFGCNDAHRKALWREIHESAVVNGAKVLDPLDWMHEAQWRIDESVPGVSGQNPNAAGRKMIEQALSNLIR